MKVVKEQEHGVVFTSYGVQDGYALTVAVMRFFNLDAPDAALKEQDMWRLAAGALGKDAALDAGMPKQHAEFLVCGKAFPADGRPVPAQEVAVQVGGVEKRLHVFGDRFWEMRGGIGVITDPAPFTAMDITWKRAFGGAEVPENPAGCGIAERPGPDGRKRVPLPNVERPDRLVGAPGDRPPPAGFLPIALDHPHRRKKAGTYDARWQRERWPYFPDDMDWTIFQTALPDQGLTDYFSGGERVVMTHLHPKRPVVESRVPHDPLRAFVWQLDRPWDPETTRTFRELPLRADTLWLFPHLERGILIHHGTVTVADDEAFDVTHLYVATDPADKPAPDIEAHFEKFQKKLDRSVAMDLSQIDAGKQKIREGMKQIVDIPKQLDLKLKQMAGDHPSATPTAATTIADAQAEMDAAITRLGEGADRLAQAREKVGHVVKIDPGVFLRAQDRIRAAKTRLGAAAETIAAGTRKTGALTKKLKDALLTPENINLAKRAGVDLPAQAETVAPEKRTSWAAEARAVTGEAAARLRRSPDAMTALSRLGLRPVGRDMALLGLIDAPLPFEPAQWGMSPDQVPQNAPEAIPPGLVMPRWKGGDIVGIVVRTGDVTDPSSDVVVPGSQLPPVALGLAPKKAVLRVADPLEAALVWQDAGDHVGVIALEGADADSGDEGGKAIADAPQFLVTLYAPDEAARTAEMAPWTAGVAGAEGLPLPEGIPIFETHRKGKDIESWVVSALDRVPTAADHAAWGMAPRADQAGADAAGIAIPAVDAKALAAHTKASVDRIIQPKVGALKDRIARRAAMVKKTLADLGHGDKFVDVDVEKTAPLAGNPLKKMDFSGKFDTMRKTLTETPGLPAATVREHLAALDRLEAQTKGLIAKSAALFEEGMGKIRALKAAGPFDDQSRKLFATVGIDPDDTAPMSREAVIERHREGRPFKGKNLQKLDLSGTSLAGIDLSEALVSRADFSGADLTGARLDKTVAEGTNFSGARLKQATISRSMLNGSVFKKADLTAARAAGNMLVGANFSGARLNGADLSRSLLQDADFTGADLSGAVAAPGYFINADFTGAAVNRATLDRSLFKDATLAGVPMKASHQQKTIYVGGSAVGADLSGSDLHNMRIVQGADFDDADFSGCDLTKASVMDSTLNNADFRASSMERAYMRNARLRGGRLSGVNAKKATFHRVDLDGADLTNADLMEGRLRKSRITGADLRGANCYRTDFFKAVVGKTRFEGANLTKTLLHNRTDLIDDEE